MSGIPTRSSRPSVPVGGQAPTAPLRGLYRAIVAATAVLVVVALVHVVMDWVAVSTARRSAATGSSSTDLYRDRLDDMSATLAVVLVGLGTVVACAVLFVVWMSRARANSEMVGSSRHRLSRGMAVGGWFIPLANLWLGRIAIEDLWRASAPTPDERRTGLVTAWWALLLGSVGFSVVSGILNPRATVAVDVSSGTVTGGLDDVASAALFVAVANTVLLVVAGIQAALFCAILLRITTWQEAGAVRPGAVVGRPVPAMGRSAGFGWGPTTPLRPVRSLGTSTVVLAWLWTALFGCAAVGGGMITAAQARRSYDGALIAAIGVVLALLVGFALLIAAGVVFARWCRRAQDNASILGRTPPRISPDWAVAGCFVPVANLVVPVRVVLDVTRHCGVRAGLVGSWWTAWLGAWVGFWLSVPQPGRRLGTAVLPMWLPAVLFAVAAVLLTVIVSAVVRHQEPAGLAR